MKSQSAIIPRPLLAPVLALVVMLTTAISTLGQAQAEESVGDPPGRVARVSLTAGAVSLEPAGTDVWISDALNRPFVFGDKLWVDSGARAEMRIGSAAIRMGSETGVEAINIDDRTLQLKLSAGTLLLRIRALDAQETIEIDTASGAVSIIEPGEYRLFVNPSDGALTLSVRRGLAAVTTGRENVSVRSGNQLRTSAGSSLARAVFQPLEALDALERWSQERDARQERSVSAQYVSDNMIGYEDLDTYGSWRTESDYGAVWYPTVTAIGWAPYQAGHWAWIAPWGWTWVDSAPWGFAPFHYGRWINMGGRWGWTPGPRQYAPVYAPALVGWIGGVGISIGLADGPPIGWFPLGWNEIYEPRYPVSNTYVRNINVTNIHVTNEYVTNYITTNGHSNHTDGNGNRYRNQAVTGAITMTTRTAFTTAQPVQQHRTELSKDVLTRSIANTQAPAIAPTLQSVGQHTRSGPEAPRASFNRPVVTLTPQTAQAVPFEQQRRAVLENSGIPVRGNRPDTLPTTRVPQPGRSETIPTPEPHSNTFDSGKTPRSSANGVTTRPRESSPTTTTPSYRPPVEQHFDTARPQPPRDIPERQTPAREAPQPSYRPPVEQHFDTARPKPPRDTPQRETPAREAPQPSYRPPVEQHFDTARPQPPRDTPQREIPVREAPAPIYRPPVEQRFESARPMPQAPPVVRETPAHQDNRPPPRQDATPERKGEPK